MGEKGRVQKEKGSRTEVAMMTTVQLLLLLVVMMRIFTKLVMKMVMIMRILRCPCVEHLLCARP